MIAVVIPLLLMIGIILLKKIPYIGGNIYVALIAGGLSALLLAGLFNPATWFFAWVDGVDRISWVMMLSIFGTVYAETQLTMGSMDTVLGVSRAAFGKSPKGLLVSIMITLALAGSLLGDAVAVSTVLGVLIIKPLNDMGLEPEEISASIVMGALLGSICPPISGALNTSAGLLGVNLDDVVKVSFITVPICIVLSCVYAAFRFVRIKELPRELKPEESAWQIFKKGWVTLVPMFVLVILIILRSGFGIDPIATLYKPFIDFISDVTWLGGLSNVILLCVFTCNIISFISPQVRKRGVVDIVKHGVKKVLPCTSVQLAAGFMLGSFYAAGLIDVVKEFALGLNEHVLKIGGSVTIMIIGMLTGSQTTAQNAIFTFFGPALVSAGVDPVNAAAAGAHLATAGQALPPADLCTFVVVGLVGGILGTKVDAVKSMIKSAPGFIFLAIAGFILLYI